MRTQDRSSRHLAIGLAVLAGYLDALGFLSLGGVFVSFMSGNSTRFAVGLFDPHAFAAAMMCLGLIVIFVIGVMIGRTIRHFVRRRPSTAILAFMSLILVCAGLLGALRTPAMTMPLLAIAMGAANNVFVREGEVSIGVTYMTGTLVKFAQRLAGALLGEEDQPRRQYLSLWGGLVLGAAMGGFGYDVIGLTALWPGVLMCAGLTLISASAGH